MNSQRRPGQPDPAWVTRSKKGVLVEVLVQPRASRDAVVGVHDEALKLRVKAPPVDERANRAVEKLLAGLLDLPSVDATVVGGRSARRKRIAIVGLSRQEVVDRLNFALAPEP